MRDCPDGEIRDLLPDYVHGTLTGEDRAVVEEHLDACEDCAEEVTVLRAAMNAFPAPKIDTAKILKAIPAAPQRARRGVFAGNQWRIAAGVGFVLLGGLTVIAIGSVFGGKTAPIVQTASAPAQPQSPVATAPTTVAAAPLTTSAPQAPEVRTKSMSFGGGLSDLTDDQLNALLTELDGLDAVGATEPETHLGVIVPPGNGEHGAQ